MTQITTLLWTQLTLLHAAGGLASVKFSTSIDGTQGQPVIWRSL